MISMQDFSPLSIDEMLISDQTNLTKIRRATVSPSTNILFHGPPGTGKTTAMRLIAIEAMRASGTAVPDYKSALQTGDVIEMGQAYGYGKIAIDHARQSASLMSLNAYDRRWLLVDEIDSIPSNNFNDWKLFIDYVNERKIQVLAATNNLSLMNAAIVDRFETVHMPYPSINDMVQWLSDQTVKCNLSEMSEIQKYSIANQSRGSMRQLRAALEMHAFKSRSE